MSYNILELIRNVGISARKVSSGKHGDEYHSHCPVCGDGSPRHPDQGPSDRFQVWPTRKPGGYYICRRCGIYGDNIQFVRDTENKSYLEACADLGIETKGYVKRPALSTPRPPVTEKPEFAPHTFDTPCEAWQAECGKFVRECHENLMSSPSVLAWLAERGIRKESVEKYLLGYNPGHKNGPIYKSRKAWGLPEKKSDNGKLKPLWLPVGLVIPLLDAEGQILQARIRRVDSDRAKFLPELKYYVIPGGCQATMVLNRDAKCFVVVEAGLDAILVAQEADGLKTGAVTSWNASAKPDAATNALLKESIKILVALDADASGDKYSRWWMENFRQAKRLTPVGGKDPGEAYAAGENIREWLLSGLPPVITRFVDVQPAATVPERKQEDDDRMISGQALKEGGSGSQNEIVMPSHLETLRRYMLRYRITISKDGQGGVEIKGLRNCPSDDAGAIANLVWFSVAVGTMIDDHPENLITARNIMDGRENFYQ
nr:hypothetical protein 11 [Deltaproteobacteria bacterium]